MGDNIRVGVGIICGVDKHPYTLSNVFPKGVCIVKSSGEGLGAARDAVAKHLVWRDIDLMVQLDDDLHIHPQLWEIISKIPRGYFMMHVIGEHVSSRVFAMYLQDYYLAGGFNPEVRYIFEDGLLYLNAVNKGLKPIVAPKHLFRHIDHPLRDNSDRWLWFNREYSRIYAAYPRSVYRNPIRFFQVPVRRGKRGLIYGARTSLTRLIYVAYYLTLGYKSKEKLKK